VCASSFYDPFLKICAAYAIIWAITSTADLAARTKAA